MTTFYLTRKGQAKIVPIQVSEVGPQYIRIQCATNAYGRKPAYRKVRRRTIFHTYHETLDMAKICVRVDLEAKIKLLKRALEEAQSELDKVILMGKVCL